MLFGYGWTIRTTITIRGANVAGNDSLLPCARCERNFFLDYRHFLDCNFSISCLYHLSIHYIVTVDFLAFDMGMCDFPFHNEYLSSTEPLDIQVVDKRTTDLNTCTDPLLTLRSIRCTTGINTTHCPNMIHRELMLGGAKETDTVIDLPFSMPAASA